MDAPLVGNPKQNYTFFYTASVSAILSVIVLLVITGYTAHTASDINEVIKDLNLLIPDAKNSLRIVKEMCRHENFTKSWGNIC